MKIFSSTNHTRGCITCAYVFCCYRCCLTKGQQNTTLCSSTVHTGHCITCVLFYSVVAGRFSIHLFLPHDTGTFRDILGLIWTYMLQELCARSLYTQEHSRLADENSTLIIIDVQWFAPSKWDWFHCGCCLDVHYQIIGLTPQDHCWASLGGKIGREDAFQPGPSMQDACPV